MANYRVSTNTNSSSSKTTQDNQKHQNEEQKQRKMDHLKLFTLKHELLKIAVHFYRQHLQQKHI
jgi:hypothetical protein